MNDEDLPLVRALAARLEARDIQPYLAERDPQPGTPLSSKIMDRIRSSALVLVFWTKRGASSEWVNQEIGAARQAGIEVVPIVERGVAVRGLLEGIERVEFDRDNPESAMESIEAYLSKMRDNAALEEESARAHQDAVNMAIVFAVVIAFAIVLALAFSRE